MLELSQTRRIRFRLNGECSKVFFYEVYADEAAFQTHWNGPLVARVRAETEGLIVKLTGERCALQE
jgi:quinol monooxygenase YgiN